jgi:hypothetical protein
MPMDGVFRTKSGTKAGLQSLPTPMPMSTDASTKAEIDGPTDYKDQVGGIVPGYAGHVPRSRDKYSGSASGGIAPERGPPPARGPQQGHVRPEDIIPPSFEQYITSSNGVVPGYTGFRPESKHVHNVSAFGGVPPMAPPGTLPVAALAQGNHGESSGIADFEWRRPADVKPAPPSFRDKVGGVIPGYTGHVAGAIEKIGTSHFGGLAPEKAPPLAQTGHEGYKISAPGQAPGQPGEKDVDLNMIPNYQGFIPRARDAFGTTIYTKGKKTPAQFR